MTEKKVLWTLFLLMCCYLVLQLWLELREPPPPPISAEPVATAPSSSPDPQGWVSVRQLSDLVGSWGALRIEPQRPGQLYRWYITYHPSASDHAGPPGLPDLVCGIADGPHATDQLDPTRGFWWIGYCHGFVLQGDDVALSVRLERRGSSLQMFFGSEGIGPFERSADAG